MKFHLFSLKSRDTFYYALHILIKINQKAHLTYMLSLIGKLNLVNTSVETCLYSIWPPGGGVYLDMERRSPAPFPLLWFVAGLSFFSRYFSFPQMYPFKWSIKFYNHYLKNWEIIVICASYPKIFLYDWIYQEWGVYVFWLVLLLCSHLFSTKAPRQPSGLRKNQPKYL